MNKSEAKAYNKASKEERHNWLRNRNAELGDEVKPPHDKHADKQPAQESNTQSE